MVDTHYTDTGYSETGHSESESHAKRAFGGSVAERIAGLGAVALTIIGLAHVFPEILVSVAIIAVGVALAFEGGAISARYSALIGEAQSLTESSVRWGGVTTLFLAGAAGIALGILSLIGVVPMILIPVSAIVFGSALIMDSGANERLSMLEARHSEDYNTSMSVAKETAKAAAGIQVLGGIGGIALGILALIGIYPLVLSLVAMLSIGTVNLLTGATIGGRMVSLFK